MKKKIVTRALVGLPAGIAVGFAITVLISLCIGDGSYYPAAPALIAAAGSEIRAVAVQGILSGVMGAAFAAASLIWEIDSWSLARQSAVYFALIAAVMLPIAYLANWMEHSLAGILSYIGIFTAIFLLVWAVQYCVWKSRIRKMNAGVKSPCGAE